MSDGVKVTITMTEGSLFVISTLLDAHADQAVTPEYRKMLREFSDEIRGAIAATPGAILRMPR